MFSTLLIILNYPVILSHRRSTTVSLETYPLYPLSLKQVEQLGWLHVDSWAGAGGSKLGTTRYVYILLLLLFFRPCPRQRLRPGYRHLCIMHFGKTASGALLVNESRGN